MLVTSFFEDGVLLGCLSCGSEVFEFCQFEWSSSSNGRGIFGREVEAWEVNVLRLQVAPRDRHARSRGICLG